MKKKSPRKRTRLRNKSHWHWFFFRALCRGGGLVLLFNYTLFSSDGWSIAMAFFLFFLFGERFLDV